MSDSDLLTQKEAASELRITTRTLERWRLTGEGPSFIKYPQKVFYTRGDLEAFKASRRRQSTSEAA